MNLNEWKALNQPEPNQPEQLHYGLRQPGVQSPVKWSQKSIAWVIGGIVAVIAVIGLVAGVSSRSADSRFIDRLDEGGIHYSSENAAIKAGKSVCDVLDAGYSVNQATYQAANGTGYSLYEAGFIVGASVYAYCDEYKGQIL